VRREREIDKGMSKQTLHTLDFIKHLFYSEYTVKPVYNGHPWDPEKVTVVQRVAVVQRLVQNTW
jgi:hypothetical protein